MFATFGTRYSDLSGHLSFIWGGFRSHACFSLQNHIRKTLDTLLKLIRLFGIALNRPQGLDLSQVRFSVESVCQDNTIFKLMDTFMCAISRKKLIDPKVFAAFLSQSSGYACPISSHNLRAMRAPFLWLS